MASVHIPLDNGPYAVAPESPVALAHWRKLRGLGLRLCISPTGPESAAAVTGRSSGLAAFQIDTAPSLKLPPLPATWTVILPSLSIRQLWFAPPLTGDGELVPGQHKPTGVSVMRLAPLPGSPLESGARFEWGETHPWNLPAPAVMPLAWWQALPKRIEQMSFRVRPTFHPTPYRESFL
jgi:hypothetical protein